MKSFVVMFTIRWINPLFFHHHHHFICVQIILVKGVTVIVASLRSYFRCIVCMARLHNRRRWVFLAATYRRGNIAVTVVVITFVIFVCDKNVKLASHQWRGNVKRLTHALHHTKWCSSVPCCIFLIVTILSPNISIITCTIIASATCYFVIFAINALR